MDSSLFLALLLPLLTAGITLIPKQERRDPMNSSWFLLLLFPDFFLKELLELLLKIGNKDSNGGI